MSSMRRSTIFTAVALLSSAATASQMGGATPAMQASATADPLAPLVRVPSTAEIHAAIASWQRLSRDRAPAFADAARFAINYPDWPGVWSENGGDSIRKRAELRLDASAPAPLVADFFRQRAPQTAMGWTRLAVSYAALGRNAEALAAARAAWRHPDLSSEDYELVRTRFANQLTIADHDARIDALLFDKQVSRAEAMLASASPARRAVFDARIALQRGSADAADKFARVSGFAASDAGLLMDRARYFRLRGDEAGAQSILAQPHQFTQRPTDVDKWYEMVLLAAEGAANRGAWATAYNIARQVDDAFAPGEDLRLQSYGVRDKYTSLTWLGGRIALDRLARPRDAASLFAMYAGGGRSLQVASKGRYWAGRALAQAGDVAGANAQFEQAAQWPDLFYGQLALERLGREIPVPPSMPMVSVSTEARQAFAANSLVIAMSALGRDRDAQALFVRALSESIDGDEERFLAADYATRIGRPDLAVWTARSARNAGVPFYYREAFPLHASGAPGGQEWSFAHGITRQESSFDRSAVSHANAYGMMQLLPSTARDQARKLGVPYDFGRLTSDPDYNVRLGSAYLKWLVDYWNGNLPLAIASYNGGMGNAAKWVKRYGDPRSPGVDTVEWIEQIPFGETRSYVQRVIENAAVYDRLNPHVPRYGAVHVSRHLGKFNRPG
ncbi:lytic transglycosylase domain-containing protein [Sphingomicrobium nitratireducens]|uniref:lytic transglycosylase domain-containing protein n=1 Tax=Sphingomicrobium nitratireducens TaxID=2964666 RepID=UPI00223EE780|nr:lytic transglycosylase domain-containing protein [Sphingomicrobium nitratireducens]